MVIGKKTEFVIEWLSTFILMIGVWLTAINYYPLNIVFSLAGNVGWLIVAIIWRKISLITIQLVVSALYIIGYLTK